MRLLCPAGASATESVVYFGADPWSDARAVGADAVPKLTFVHHRLEDGRISVDSARFVAAERSGVPEFSRALIPDGAEITGQSDGTELSFELAFPLDVRDAGRYQVTLRLLPAAKLEDGQVRIVVEGRRVSGGGAEAFRHEVDGWFLTFP